jgi:hypothetical protein
MRYPIVFIFLVLFSISCIEDRVTIVSKIIESVGNKYAPDSRLARYEIKLAGYGKEFILSGSTTEKEAIDQLQKKLDSLGLVYNMKVDILPPDTARYKHGLVNVSVANLRAYRRNSAELVTQAWLGYPMTILQSHGDWLLVRGPDNYIGYLDKRSLTLLSDEEFQIWQEKPKWICTARQTWLYKKPMDSNVVSDMVLGNLLVLRSKEGIMVELEMPDGTICYANRNDGMPVSEWLETMPDQGDFIVTTAQSMMGVPYLWGGTSTKGMDCSGFTRTVFARYGYLLERDASLQARTGIELPVDTTFEMYQPGDLFFFGTERERSGRNRKNSSDLSDTGKYKITHVAIYIGNGKIIHSSGKVKVESLKRGDPDFAEDRFDTWVQSRRVLGAGGKEDVIKFEQFPYLTYH